MFSSSPSGGSESMQLMYQLAITAAERSIDLSSAYFVPDELTQPVRCSTPSSAACKLRIIAPGRNHRHRNRARAPRAAPGGRCWRPAREIYEYQPTMYHCKVMIVDDLLVSVGSTNFDNRSFRLNDEANLNVYDPVFAARQTRVFEQDLKRSRRITYAGMAEPAPEGKTQGTAGAAAGFAALTGRGPPAGTKKPVLEWSGCERPRKKAADHPWSAAFVPAYGGAGGI